MRRSWQAKADLVVVYWAKTVAWRYYECLGECHDDGGDVEAVVAAQGAGDRGEGGPSAVLPEVGVDCLEYLTLFSGQRSADGHASPQAFLRESDMKTGLQKSAAQRWYLG